MSLLIKGMEMPVTCCHCPLMGYDPDIEWNDGGRETQGAYICVLTHELIDNTKREDHCPLVPVPKHGRLGDLDDFAKRMKDLVEKANNDGFDLGAAWYSAFVRHIELTPTVIEAEEGET